MSTATERKGWRKRVNSATVTGSAPKFAPSDDGWRQIGQAYRCAFSEADRQAISAAADEYFDAQRFEEAAPPVTDVVTRIKKVEKAARTLNGTFPILFGGYGADGDAAFRAQMAIEQSWLGADHLGSEKLSAFHLLGLTLVGACTRARQTLADDGRVWEGAAWDQMIRRLAGFARDRGLRVSVRKDSDKQVDFKPSAFVAFVGAIEDQFPPGGPRRSLTPQSLSNEIARVVGIKLPRKKKK